jgi:hypothetical protein
MAGGFRVARHLFGVETMAHRQVIATRTGRYGTRMLTAGDALTLSGPAARAMIALGRATEKPKRARRPQLDHDDNGREGGSKSAGGNLTALRAEYREKLGKNPFNGWDAATLREKIAAA